MKIWFCVSLSTQADAQENKLKGLAKVTLELAFYDY